MSGENSSDGLRKTRSILGDVTNQLGKRSLVSSILGPKLGDSSCEIVNKKESSQFANKARIGVENLEKEKCITKSIKQNDTERGKRACISLINSLNGNFMSGISRISSEIKEPNLLDPNSHLSRSNALTQNVIEAGDASRDSCVSGISMPISSYDTDCLGIGGKCEGRVSSEAKKNESLHEQLVTDDYSDDGDDLGIDNLASGKCVSIECFTLPESQESRCFELERCEGLKGNGCSYSRAGVDCIKACSCSFCTKAAYIWSDLHYQDIKGRIAALKKSQKEASVLVQKSCRKQGIDKQCQESSNKFSKTESDLVGQWRSLFRHMEDILGHESSQLEASLLTLKDLRDNCKTELELINEMPLEKQ